MFFSCKNQFLFLYHFAAGLIGFTEVFEIHFQHINNIFLKFGKACAILPQFPISLETIITVCCSRVAPLAVRAANVTEPSTILAVRAANATEPSNTLAVRAANATEPSTTLAVRAANATGPSTTLAVRAAKATGPFISILTHKNCRNNEKTYCRITWGMPVRFHDLKV
ncbi:MAG: hypothetical protein LBD52_04130 [Prevotellaceae bacterium]|nr:hypothetical protein [Prevotellaceae bacterium]